MVYTLVSKGVGDKRGQGTFCYLQLGDIFFKREWAEFYQKGRDGSMAGELFYSKGGEQERAVFFKKWGRRLWEENCDLQLGDRNSSVYHIAGKCGSPESFTYAN